MSFVAFLLFAVRFSLAIEEIYPNDIEAVLNTQPGPSLVLFYKQNDPVSDHLRTALKNVEPKFNGYGLAIGEFDCTNNEDKCSNPRIKQVPAITYTQQPDTHCLLGDKNEQEILKWVNLEMRKTIRHFATREEAESAFEGFDRAVIGYFPTKDCPEYTTYYAARQNIREGDVWIAIVNENIPEVRIEHLDIRLNVVHVYNDSLAPSPEQSQGWRIYHFIMFVTRCVTPIVQELTGETNRRYFQSEQPVCFVFIDSGRVQYDLQEQAVSYNDPKVMLRTIAPLALKYEDKMQFCVVDNQQYWRYAQTVGLTGNVFPSFSIVSNYEHAIMPGAKVHFPFHCAPPSSMSNAVENGQASAPVNEPEIEDFVDNFISGSLPITLRSEPIPEQNTTVMEIVGDTFNQTVFESGKYVFVTFYAPWCERCKELHPLIDAIAEELKNDSRVLLARMDSTKNDMYPGIVVDGFPTLLLFMPNDPTNILRCYDFYDDSLIRRFLHDNIPDLKIDLKMSPEEEERYRRFGDDFDLKHDL